MRLILFSLSRGGISSTRERRCQSRAHVKGVTTTAKEVGYLRIPVEFVRVPTEPSGYSMNGQQV